jgi:hypothetical protein
MKRLRDRGDSVIAVVGVLAICLGLSPHAIRMIQDLILDPAFYKDRSLGLEELGHEVPHSSFSSYRI